MKEKEEEVEEEEKKTGSGCLNNDNENKFGYKKPSSPKINIFCVIKNIFVKNRFHLPSGENQVVR